VTGYRPKVKVPRSRPKRRTGPPWHDAQVSSLILFDLDGTLTDSGPGIVEGLRYALDAMGIEHPDDTTMRTFLGPPLLVTFRDHFNMSPDQIDKAIALYREHYNDTGLFNNIVFDGIPELLNDLQERNHTLVTATSKPTETATRILEHFDLAKHFVFIGGATMDSSRALKAEVIAHTLAEINADRFTTITMVGDRGHDVIGAREHGIDTIGVTWGYGTVEELTNAGASLIVDQPAQILNAQILTAPILTPPMFPEP
jgi:phosphoglycolate phosphatase